MQLERFWKVLGDLAGHGQIWAQWQEDLGDEFERTSRFLHPTDELATAYPCPRPGGEGCPREVIHHSADDIVAACRDVPPMCDLVQLTKDEIIVYELDLEVILEGIGEAFGLRVGHQRESHACWTLGVAATPGSPTVPVLLGLVKESTKLEELVSQLVLDREQRFLLLIPFFPTVSPVVFERLRRHGSEVIALSEAVVLNREGLFELNPDFRIPGFLAEADRVLPNTFRCDGGSWWLVYKGKSVVAKDSKGLRYLQLLLQSPGEEIDCTILVSEGATPDTLLPLGRSIEKYDAEGLKRLKDEIDSARSELDEAREFNNTGRVEASEIELARLLSELKTSSGLGERVRSSGGAATRIPDSVSRAIKRAVARLEVPHQALHSHLKGSLRYGTTLRYLPPNPTSWITE